MKKNGQYVGVDEKYIPEEEKYVDNSINEEVKDSINDGIRSVKNYVTDKDNQENFKKAGRKGLKVLKGLGIGYLCFIGVIIVIIITVFILAFSFIFKTNKTINNKFNDVNDQSDKITDTVTDIFDDVMDQADEQLENNKKEELEYEANLFNLPFELYVGTESGFHVSSLLDEVSTNNKKEPNHIITVIYNDITTTIPDEIVSIKQSLESSKNYEVSFDYDQDGYINKVTIK